MKIASKLWFLALGAWVLLSAGMVSGPAAQEKNPIVIGGSLGLTGQFARMGEETGRAFDIWKEEVNARGGLLGRPVQIKVYDDQSDPTTSAKLYERLVVQDKVELVYSPYASSIAEAASAVTEKYKIPMVAQGASAQRIWERGFKYIFQIYPKPEGQLIGMLDVAKKARIKSIAIATEDTTFPKELALIFQKLAKERGFDVVFYEEYGKSPTDLSPLVLKMKAKNPDMIFGSAYLPECVLIMRHAKELNFNPKLYAFTIGPALDDWSKTLGNDGDLVTGVSLWESTSKNPGAQAFVEGYRARYKDLPPYQTAAAYAGMQILEAAVKKAGSFDREKIRHGLQSLEMNTIFGPYKVDSNGSQEAKRAYVFQVQKGVRRIVWPDDSKEADLIFPTPPWGTPR
jgi:branched-chain amino acid transport system substrate-binding protein